MEMKFLRTLCFAVLALAPITLLSQSTPAGGVITNNTTWSPALGTILVYSNVIISGGATLMIEAGTLVHLTNNVSISAAASSGIDVQGTSANPVLFTSMVGNNKWGNLSASGASSFVTVRHAEVANGGINFGSQATGLIEDTFIHDVFSAIVANSAKFVTMRRNHVRNFSETIFNSGTIILAEDSLYENMTAANSDSLEIQGGPPGSIIRRCTFRHSSGGNSDSLDFNGTSGVLVQDCLVYDFSDKAVSMGASGAGGSPDNGMTISNCLFYQVDTGVAVKDGSTCGLYNLTIVDNTYGIREYQKFTTPVDGGHITNSYNNIIWGNRTNLFFLNNSSMVANHSDIQGTNYPGTGNLSAIPLFVNQPQQDYRLGPGSPATGAGLGGGDLGAHFPVGAPMALSHPRFESILRTGTNASLSFWLDSEKTYSILASDSLTGGTWQKLTNYPTRLRPVLMTIADPLPETGVRFYRIVTPQVP
jgi:hypothetical protein